MIFLERCYVKGKLLDKRKEEKRKEEEKKSASLFGYLPSALMMIKFE